MIRTTLLALSALALATAPAMAATSTNAATRAVSAVPVRKVAVAKPALRAASTAKPRGKSGMVTATLANGKKVTYDCRLAGNKTKTACKGKG